VKTVADRHRLATDHNKTLPTSFPVVPTSMTLNDLTVSFQSLMKPQIILYILYTKTASNLF